MFTVYTKDNCTFCDQAKALLEREGLDYETIKLGEGITREELIAKIPSARTMPQIVRHDRDTAVVIGGFTELKKFLHTS